jgi:intein-encoded DNA endonuclease-like protein
LKGSNAKQSEYPLYQAFKKYGIDNFTIEVFEKCTISSLNAREIYWIKEINTFHYGYNQTLGGKSVRTLELNEEFVIDFYKQNKTISKTAKYFNISNATVREVLKKNNINIASAKEHASKKGTCVLGVQKTEKSLKNMKHLKLQVYGL